MFLVHGIPAIIYSIELISYPCGRESCLSYGCPRVCELESSYCDSLYARVFNGTSLEGAWTRESCSWWRKRRLSIWSYSSNVQELLIKRLFSELLDSY